LISRLCLSRPCCSIFGMISCSLLPLTCQSHWAGILGQVVYPAWSQSVQDTLPKISQISSRPSRRRVGVPDLCVRLIGPGKPDSLTPLRQHAVPTPCGRRQQRAAVGSGYATSRKHASGGSFGGVPFRSSSLPLSCCGRIARADLCGQSTGETHVSGEKCRSG
jgi:hypothetical protein